MRFHKSLLLIVSLCMVAAMPVSAIGPTDSHFNGALWSPPGNGEGYIGCSLYGGGLQCSGATNQDDDSSVVWCSSTDPKMKRLLPAINGKSSVQFFYDAQLKCTHVDVTNGAFGGVTAVAGAKVSQPVWIGSDSVWGTVSAVKSYPDKLSCTAGTSDNGISQVVCSARDRSGTEVLCSSTASSTRQTLDDQILAVSSINESSYVNFTWSNTSPTKTCTSVNVWNNSLYLP